MKQSKQRKLKHSLSKFPKRTILTHDERMVLILLELRAQVVHRALSIIEKWIQNEK